MEMHPLFKLVGPLGVVNLLLLAWQLASGLRWVKATPRLHRQSGILLCVTATLHALLAAISSPS